MKNLITSLLFTILFTSFTLAQNKPMGWLSNPKHSKNLKQFVHHPAFKVVSLPEIVDLSGVMPDGPKVDKNHMPPIYDQGQIGSCTAQAGTAAFDFLWHKQFGEFFDGSKLGLYTCSLMHDNNWPKDFGSYTSTVVWVLKNQGQGTEKCFPYSKPFGTPLPKCYLADAKKHMVVNAYDVDSTDKISIRTAIAKGYPVMFGGFVYPSIQNLNSKNYFNPPPSGAPIGGHERLIVGYNSTLTYTFNGKTYTGFYWVRNSWGGSWGYKGYSWDPMVVIENPRTNEDFAVIDVATDNKK